MGVRTLTLLVQTPSGDPLSPFFFPVEERGRGGIGVSRRVCLEPRSPVPIPPQVGINDSDSPKTVEKFRFLTSVYPQ